VAAAAFWTVAGVAPFLGRDGGFLVPFLFVDWALGLLAPVVLFFALSLFCRLETWA